MPKIIIDEGEYEAPAGMTVLEVARENGIRIPTLCYHPALKPSGSCRLCAVEVKGGSGRPVAMLSCILKAREGLVVRTDSEMVVRARTKAFQRLVQMAPQSEALRELAAAHDVELGLPPDGCVRCRLCVRVCKEIVGPGALKMVKTEKRSHVVPEEGLCIGCGTCANICPTGVIRVADVDRVRTVSIGDKIIGRHPLERCQGCGNLYATEKFLKHIETRTSPHPDVKTHHRYCPTCAKLFSDRIKSMGSRFQKQRMPGHH